MECVAVAASESTGHKAVADIHPQLRGIYDLTSVSPDAARFADAGVETVFLCTPNEVSYEIAAGFIQRAIRVVDLSGSFRLKASSSYSPWYGFDHLQQGLLDRAAYGLTEWNERAIAAAELVANPGCYPTSVLLGLLPLGKAGMLEVGSEIICDAKSGVTGAGRTARLDLSFGEVAENFRAYSPVSHRHLPEMCEQLEWDLRSFVFVPHLLPVSRGILSTIYVRFQEPVSSEEIESEFRRRYEEKPFVRILGGARLPELRCVTGTNFCDIGWRLTRGGRTGIVFSAIDNLVKGAAGQAVQNFNVMHGLDQSAGLL
jgi:N-acetyl-gamma-glutamyl-phosphate reductase